MIRSFDHHLRILLLALPLFAFASSWMIACGSAEDDSTSTAGALYGGYGYGR
jgi:hypothetical protein